MILRPWVRKSWPLVPIILALVLTSLLLIQFGTSPQDALAAMIEGSLAIHPKFCRCWHSWFH